MKRVMSVILAFLFLLSSVIGNASLIVVAEDTEAEEVTTTIVSEKLEFENDESIIWGSGKNSGSMIDSTKKNMLVYLGDIDFDSLKSITVHASTQTKTPTLTFYALVGGVTYTTDVTPSVPDTEAIGSVTLEATDSWTTFTDAEVVIAERTGIYGLFMKITNNSDSSWAGNYDYLMLNYERNADDPIRIVLKQKPNSRFHDGIFEGWGTTLCWWANRTGYNEELSDRLVEQFFGEEGLGLDIARYNIGGGDDPTHNHIARSDSKMPGLLKLTEDATQNEDGTWNYEGNTYYNWDADYNQVNVMKKILALNPDVQVEAFSNSPPYFMTKTGCSSGGSGTDVDNLREDSYNDFADFLAEVVKHFREEENIDFVSLEPMNEPQNGGGSFNGSWKGFNNKQEGCNFYSLDHQSTMLVELEAAMRKKGVSDIPISATDDGRFSFMKRSLNGLSDEAMATIDRVNFHTYSADWDGNRETFANLVEEKGKSELWMDEVDNGDWSAGVDAGDMSLPLGFAQHLMEDVEGTEASAWIIWQVTDKHFDSNSTVSSETTDKSLPTWGLGLTNHDDNTFTPNKKYYAYAQFTKYIHPGDIITESGDNLMVAYQPDTGRVTIVAINDTAEVQKYSYVLSDFDYLGDTATAVRTSGSLAAGENLRSLTDVALENDTLTTTLAPNSITTFVIEGADKLEGLIPSEEVYGNLNMPTEYSGLSLIWDTSDDSIITTDGVVTRPSEDTEVTLSVNAYSRQPVLLTDYDAGSYQLWADNETAKPITVLYDRYGQMKDCSLEEAGGFEDAIDSDDVKVFVWDENMTPLSKPVTKVAQPMITKEYTVTVKAQSETEEAYAYLFTHFVGSESSEDDEQIYFSVSTDALKWTLLNDSQPILRSSMGEKGLRDPHIIRSPEGDKFYMIATDLSIYNNLTEDGKQDWGRANSSGSHSIMVWESTDLVNWSEQRMVEIAPEGAGCAWAPESVWDEKKGAYMVFWASNLQLTGDSKRKHRIYRSYTRDFVTFTEPEMYVEKENDIIDSTIIEADGVYYRYSKDESQTAVICETATDSSGTWTLQESFTPIDDCEGPTAFRMINGKQWALYVDFFSSNSGYRPRVTDDISSGVFTAPSGFTSDVKLRHGTIIPITKTEYDALLENY
ncbi:MAG: glycoside hydrolase [Lachnospiraceae bacterium]